MSELTADVLPDGVEVDEDARRIWFATPEKFLAFLGGAIQLGLLEPGNRFRCGGYELGIRSGPLRAGLYR